MNASLKSLWKSLLSSLAIKSDKEHKEHTVTPLKSIQYVTNRISNRFNSTAAYLELYEPYMLERFCENNEQLKEVIYFRKRLPSQIFYRALKTPLVYTLRSFPLIYFTSLVYICWIQLLSMRSWKVFSRTYSGRLLLKLVYWNKSITIESK